MDQPPRNNWGMLKLGSQWKNFPQFTIPLINVQHLHTFTRIYSKNSLGLQETNSEIWANQFTMIANSLNQIRSIIGPPKKKGQMFQTYNGTNMKIWDKHEVWPISKLVDHKSYPFGILQNRDVATWGRNESLIVKYLRYFHSVGSLSHSLMKNLTISIPTLSVKSPVKSPWNVCLWTKKTIVSIDYTRLHSQSNVLKSIDSPIRSW